MERPITRARCSAASERALFGVGAGICLKWIQVRLDPAASGPGHHKAIGSLAGRVQATVLCAAEPWTTSSCRVPSDSQRLKSPLPQSAGRCHIGVSPSSSALDLHPQFVKNGPRCLFQQRLCVVRGRLVDSSAVGARVMV
jgi:hypothetical protein